MASRPNSPYMLDPAGSFGYGAIPLLAQARQQLEQQALAGTQAQQAAMGGEPNARMYGVFGPAYAQSLNAPSDSASERFLNRTALMMNADAEREAYGVALENAGNTAARLAAIEAAGPIEVARLNNEREAILRGGGRTEVGPDGIPRVVYDDALTMRDNQLGANAELAETLKNNLGAVRDGYESGYDILPEVVSGYFTPPGQEVPTPIGRTFDTGLNPDDELGFRELPIKQQQADAALLSAQASMHRAETGQDDLQETVIVDPNTGRVLRREYRGPVGSMDNSSGGNPAASPSTPAQATIINRANAAGASTRMVGDTLEVTRSDGQKLYIDPSGRPVSAPGGAIEQ